MILERRCEYCIYYNEEPSFSLYLFSSDCKKRDTCDIEIRDSIILRARTNVTKRYREQTYIRKYPESLFVTTTWVCAVDLSVTLAHGALFYYNDVLRIT